MTLSELCEPLFQYICRLRRSERMGCVMEMDQVRTDIKRLFKEMAATASTSAELDNQYEKIELPLLFFVDFMIKESKLDFAPEWIELGSERNELAGDQKFFDLLEENLVDRSDAATERLLVFYSCLCLGFTGVHAEQPGTIRKLVSKISSRIVGSMDADEKSYICPEAYENVDARDFVEPAGTKLVEIGIVLIGVVIIIGIAFFWLFRSTASDVAQYVDHIVKIVNGNENGSAARTRSMGIVIALIGLISACGIALYWLCGSGYDISSLGLIFGRSRKRSSSVTGTDERQH